MNIDFNKIKEAAKEKIGDVRKFVHENEWVEGYLTAFGVMVFTAVPMAIGYKLGYRSATSDTCTLIKAYSQGAIDAQNMQQK